VSYVLYLATIKVLFCVCLAHAGQRGLGNPAAAGVALATDSIKPLQIGDTIPEALWYLPLQMVKTGQEGSTTITLNDYKDKLIILDFWATWCTPCLAAMPKIRQLQSQFEQDVVIVPVTSDAPTIIQETFAQKSFLNNMKISSVVNDTTLKKYFPHHGLPHIVWLASNGRFLNASQGEDLSAANINAGLKGEKPLFTTKIDIDINKPLFTIDHLAEQAVESFGVLISGYVPGLPVGSRFRTDSSGIRGRVITNRSALTLYEAAISKLMPNYSQKLRFVRVADSSKLHTGFSDTWYDTPHYSYELMVPHEKVDSLYHFMLTDLNRYLPYRGEIKDSLINCYALERINEHAVIPTSEGGKRYVSAQKYAKGEKQLKNAPLYFFVRYLNEEEGFDLPVVDLTAIDHPVDIKWSSKPDDLKGINRDLKNYGLILQEKMAVSPVFIITDKK